MPIDPSIALGVRPVEQPNVLGQMAQMMQMRQAQQEYENEGGLRNALTGGLPEDPSSLLKYGKSGRAVYESAIKGRKEQLDSAEKRLTLTGQIAGYVRDNPTPENFVRAVDTMVQNFVLTRAQAERVIADAGNDPAKIKLYATQAASSAVTEADKMRDKTTRDTNAATVGASYYSSNVSRDNSLRTDERLREQNEYDRANPSLYHFTGPDGTLMVAPQRGSGAARPVPMAGSSAPPPQVTIGGGGAAPTGSGSSIMVNPSPINALAPVNQNALITQPQPTPAPAAPTFAQVRATPVTKDIVDPTDPTGRRMITVEVNTYKAGTGLGVDGKQAAPAGVLGVASSPIQPNYMRDPNNPLGVIPVPGSAADPNAVVPPNYRKTADGKGLEPIPGGPADPKVIAAQNTVKLSAKDAAAREASYPRATTALKSFDAKTDKFDRDIAELLANEKGLNEITGFFAGRTDLAAMSNEARRALALFNTITAKGGFSELQDMRNASPTGGALGNVSNQEGKQLIDSFAALSRTQNANDVRKSLETARSDLQNLKQRMREAYDLTYEYRNSGGGAPALPPGFKAD